VHIPETPFFSLGYHGDLNETYPVGKIDDDSESLIRTTRQALAEAIKICKPGALFRDIGKVMCVIFLSPVFFLEKHPPIPFLLFREPIARANGCAVVRTYTGHGVNDLFHCSPNIPHYGKNKAVGTMKAGMVSQIQQNKLIPEHKLKCLQQTFSIEPVRPPLKSKR